MGKLKKTNYFSIILKYGFIIVGSLLAAFALECFLVPNSILDGGVNGISIILNLKFGFSLGLTIVLINLPFMYIGYKNLGWKFITKALFSIITFSIFLEIFKDVKEITDNILLACVYGSALLGCGVGIIIKCGGCLDGTESVGIVISKKTNFSVGQFVLLCNVVIFGVAGFFFGIDRALYSLLAYFITSKVVDEVSEGLNKAKAAMIITNDGKEITEAIYKNIGRTVTRLEGTGFISGNKEVLYCVLTRIEIPELKRIVLESDASAFITISDISEIIGSHIKDNHGVK